MQIPPALLQPTNLSWFKQILKGRIYQLNCRFLSKTNFNVKPCYKYGTNTIAPAPYFHPLFLIFQIPSSREEEVGWWSRFKLKIITILRLIHFLFLVELSLFSTTAFSKLNFFSLKLHILKHILALSVHTLKSLLHINKTLTIMWQ